MEYLIAVLFMVTPPTVDYRADGNCSDLYSVKEAYAIGGCTGFESRDKVAKYKLKQEAFKKLFIGE